MRLAMVSDSVFGAAEGPTGDLKPDYSVSATQWTPGGFAWYAPAIRMMAFKAWKQPEGALADNSLYWFMNYLGLGCTDSLDCIGTEPDLLRDYIRKLKALDDSGDPFLNTDVYSALQSIRETPAAVRSVRQSAYWLRYGAEDDPWLRESLASIAGRFSKADSSLTGEATSLAKKNLNSWQFYRPAVLDTANIPQVMEPVAAYDLPDLSAFLIARPPQQPAGKPAFLLYPNPAHDYIQVQPLAAYTYDTPWEGFIVAADGRNSVYIRIQSWEDQRINISRLPAGVYLVELFSGNQYLGASKFVKITTR
jgi:hypothetical protein